MALVQSHIRTVPDGVVENNLSYHGESKISQTSSAVSESILTGTKNGLLASSSVATEEVISSAIILPHHEKNEKSLEDSAKTTTKETRSNLSDSEGIPNISESTQNNTDDAFVWLLVFVPIIGRILEIEINEGFFIYFVPNVIFSTSKLELKAPTQLQELASPFRAYSREPRLYLPLHRAGCLLPVRASRPGVVVLQAVARLVIFLL